MSEDRNMFIGMVVLVLLLIAGIFGCFAYLGAIDHRHERNQLNRCLQQRSEKIICAVGSSGH